MIINNQIKNMENDKRIFSNSCRSCFLFKKNKNDISYICTHRLNKLKSESLKITNNDIPFFSKMKPENELSKNYETKLVESKIDVKKEDEINNMKEMLNKNKKLKKEYEELQNITEEEKNNIISNKINEIQKENKIVQHVPQKHPQEQKSTHMVEHTVRKNKQKNDISEVNIE